MRPMRNSLFAPMLAGLLALAPMAPAEPAGPDLARVAARVHAMAGAKDLLAACPGDVFDTLAFPLSGPGKPWDAEDGTACAADPEGCVARCAFWGDADACTDLGIMLELRDGDRLAARIAHARGCALGSPSGCTNRGGGIRNVPLEGDALSQQPQAEIAACLFRTFDAACKARDSWACAMLGQAHEWGEGVPADPGKARQAYAMACDLAEPGFAACAFAQDALARIGGDPVP